jgi:YgiT-type zinc finger domain-containing protein
MKCFICNQAETVAGSSSVLFERGHASLTNQSVPVRVCPECGEAYAEESVATNLLRQAEELARDGSKVEVCEYAPGEENR